MNQDLYDRIEKDDEASDAEKRENYFTAIQDEKDEQDWEDEQSGTPAHPTDE